MPNEALEAVAYTHMASRGLMPKTDAGTSLLSSFYVLWETITLSGTLVRPNEERRREP